ncbi:hypothetical protein M885DRAFT_526045 [Pelagophyceae sp. CCMP2097]|nr:hypothetical protein M885DRAFT_526045 [Pelagophyceae sp. CCMP2097]
MSCASPDHGPDATDAYVIGNADGYEGAEPSTEVAERALHYTNSIVEDIYRRWDGLCPEEMVPGLEAMVEALSENTPMSEKELASRLQPLRKQYKLAPRKAQILHVYRAMLLDGRVKRSQPLEEVLTTKASKSQSGVLVVTVLTSPFPSVAGGPAQKFSCKWNCYYCPNQPGQPRSYLRDEPAVLRANQNRFDAVMQFTERCATLAQNGHPVDKVELLVLGGTWSSYPLEYREAFCRDLYYAANTFWDVHSSGGRGMERRPRRSLRDEQELNEAALCKIIGLTLETRPDTITPEELRLLRSYGCTRVQLGVQHIDEGILKKVNRGHGRQATADALRLLKDACYKVDIHLMPNLPGSTPAVDLKMFESVLSDEDLQADQWKIYPCEVTPWTVIKKWFDEGSYVPYADLELHELLCAVKAQVHPWIRLNRVVRDIPSHYILGGVDAPNMREDVLVAMRRKGLRCKCIRCREVGDIGGLNQQTFVAEPSTEIRAGQKTTRKERRVQRTGDAAGIKKWSLRTRQNRDGVLARRSSEALAPTAVLTRRTYAASGGVEHFISFETADEATIFGFLRLRLSAQAGAAAFPALEECALIRELHVYGQLVPGGRTDRLGVEAQQHRGFGKRMLADAERIAREAGFEKIAVISGVGTRDYYRKLGFRLEGDGDYLLKQLPKLMSWTMRAYQLAVLVIVLGFAAAQCRALLNHESPLYRSFFALDLSDKRLELR